MSNLQTDELNSLPQTETAEAGDGPAAYETLVQTLDEYSALLNCLLSALNASRSAPDRAPSSSTPAAC